MRELPLGKSELLRQGDDLTFLAAGPVVHEAIKAADQLSKDNLNCSVINTRFIKPFDQKIYDRFAENTKLVITVEENVLQGGYGSLVLETMPDQLSSKGVHRIGIPDSFVAHGTPQFLRKRYGLDSKAICKTVKSMLGTEGIIPTVKCLKK